MSDVEKTKYYAGGFFYNPANGKVLLQKRTKDAPHFPGIWAIFGGGEEDEDGGDPVQTFIREVKEEMSVDIVRDEIVPLFDYLVYNNTIRRYVFYVESDINESDIVIGEGEKFEWFSFDEAEKLELGPKTREDLEKFKKIVNV
jgi:8-oxo-dGTP diphosphatase